MMALFSFMPDLGEMATVLGGIIVVVLGFLGFGAIKKREGKKEARHETEINDLRRADDIRRRAPDGVHDDEIRYRD